MKIKIHETETLELISENDAESAVLKACSAKGHFRIEKGNEADTWLGADQTSCILKAEKISHN